MEIKAKDMKDNEKVICVGANNAQSILHGATRFAYSAGKYGWDCDYYSFPCSGFILCTGYRPVGRVDEANNTVIEIYNRKAKFIFMDNSISSTERIDAIGRLRKTMVGLLV